MRESKPRRRDLEKERYWRSKIENWKASGLSQMEFCRREHLNFHTFSSWTYIIRERDLENLQEKNRAAELASGRRKSKTTDPEPAVWTKNNFPIKNHKAKGALFVKAVVEDDIDGLASRSMLNGVTPNDTAQPTPSIAAELYRSDSLATIRIYNGADAATVSALIAAFSSC